VNRLDDSGAQFEVLIAPGTSLKSLDKPIFPGDLVVGDDTDERLALQKGGLTKVTKFQMDCKHRLWLPYNSEFFECAPNSRTPVQGYLDVSIGSIKRKLDAAKRAVNWSKEYPQ